MTKPSKLVMLCDYTIQGGSPFSRHSSCAPGKDLMLSPRLITDLIYCIQLTPRKKPTITIFGSKLDWSRRPGSRLQTPRFPPPYLVNSKELLLHLLKSSTLSSSSPPAQVLTLSLAAAHIQKELQIDISPAGKAFLGQETWF